MQNLGSYKLHSISRTLSVGLIITLVLVAVLSLGVNFILSSRKAKAELEARVEEYTSALTDALKVPLWAYSEETIEAICESYAQNELVAKLLLEDQKGAVILKKNKLINGSLSRDHGIFSMKATLLAVSILGWLQAITPPLIDSYSSHLA